MSKFSTTIALFAALISNVAGHTAVEEFEIGGKTYEGFYQGSIEAGTTSPAWATNQGWGYQPVFGDKLNHPDIIAHMDAVPSPYTAEAPAGSNVTFTWHHKGECLEGEEGWDCSHHGWTATYLAPYNGDSKNIDKTKLEFFKIHQVGLIDYRQGRYSKGRPEEQTGYWGTDAIFYDNGNTQTITIPADIPSGNYVLRTEVMSIHNNGGISDVQFWPQAFNIKVTGGDDNAQIPAGVKATELYNANDDILTFDLYWHTAGETFSDVPGPEIYSATETKKARRSHARDFSS